MSVAPRADPDDGPEPRTITVLSSGRQDWGILHPVCDALRAVPGVRLDLAVGGMHLSQLHGHTVDLVRADGFEPDAELDWLGVASPAGDPSADVQAAGALTLVAAHLRAVGPAALVLVGDRLETAAAALAATLEGVPIAHLHGGEQTSGAFDDALRHAITKLSHLHLVSSAEYGRRVVALGEDPSTVHVVGAPGVDAAQRTDLPDRAALAADLGIDLEPPVVVVTVHPTTLEGAAGSTLEAVIAAMDAVDGTYVITLPNTDPGAAAIRSALERAAARPRRVAVEALGERRYWGLLRLADAMLGNSSSGLIEAPAIGLPVVDVGDRQAGRTRAANIVHAEADRGSASAALRRALDPAFRSGLAASPDGGAAGSDSGAGARAARIIGAWRPPRPPRKAPITVVT